MAAINRAPSARSSPPQLLIFFIILFFTLDASAFLGWICCYFFAKIWLIGLLFLVAAIKLHYIANWLTSMFVDCCRQISWMSYGLRFFIIVRNFRRAVLLLERAHRSASPEKVEAEGLLIGR